MTSDDRAYTEPRYGNWRRPRAAGLADLGALGTAILFIGLIAGILSFALWGLVPGLAVMACFAAALAFFTLQDAHGISFASRVGGLSVYTLSRWRGMNLYRAGPIGALDCGRYQLPGLAATSLLYEYPDTHGRLFALLHLPTTGHYTAVMSTEPDGAALVDSEQIDAWVANWGGWLTALADESGVVAASVTIETSPDSGYRLCSEIESQLVDEAPEAAQTMLREVMALYPQGSAAVRAWIALTFNAAVRPGARRRNPDEMAQDLAARLPGLCQRLQTTGAGIARLMPAQELCEVIRVSYDPSAGRTIDEAHASGRPVTLSWDDVGPVAAEARWDMYRHDGAFSVSWTMTGAPRGSVHSGVLARLLSPSIDVARKRVSLLYRPIDSAKAAQLVERDQNNANVRISSANRPSARALVDARLAARTAAEEAQGAGLVNFGMVVTATVIDGGQLADAVADVEQTSGASRILLRRAYGSQDTAFAASLPLGLVLPRHVMLPSELREAL
jgi:hypothetical protein